MQAIQQFQCPNCGSEQIKAHKRGFDLKSAIVGDVIAGPVGILAGTIGSNDAVLTCLTCGNVFYAEVSVMEEANALVETPLNVPNDSNTKEAAQKTVHDIDMLKDFEAVTSVFFFVAGFIIIGFMLYKRFF